MLKARLISMPGSTSGKFIKDSVFPQIGIADKVSVKVTARGIESTNMLAAGASDVALGPVSELDWWEGANFADGCALAFVPTEHFSGRTPWDRNSTLWGAYVLKLGARTIYFGADSVKLGQTEKGITVIAINLFGDALIDALDIRSRMRTG